MLDPEHSGQLTLQSLKKRLGPLMPDMSAKDYRFLMNNKKEMSIEDLRELLVDNEVANYDPVFDAFRMFDPKCTGFIDEDKLRLAFMSFGLGELSDEELDILKRVSWHFLFICPISPCSYLHLSVLFRLRILMVMEK